MRRKLKSDLALALRPCLADREFRVRWAATEALGVLHVEPRSVIPALVAMAKDEGGHLPADGLTYHAFQQDYVLGRSDKGGQPLREAAIRALGGFGPRAAGAVPVLLQFLGDEAPRIRWFAAEALALIGPEAKAAVPMLIEALRSPDEATGATEDSYVVLTRAPIRLIAAYALGRIGPDARAAVPALTGALSGPDSRVRGEAARALGRIGLDARPAVPELIRLATRVGIVPVAEQATVAILSLGPDARAGLVAVLQAPDPEIRLRALEILKLPIGKQPLPVVEIARCLADPDAEVRLAAAAALAASADRPEVVASIPRLAFAVGDCDREFADSAAVALTFIIRPLLLPIPAILSPGRPLADQPDDGFKAVRTPIGLLP